ncbi:NAD(P)-dependent alcohol dehydrogenase [Parasalinivibrio latis]|uniref:NAD(P)-dependent alcohol dehydrogenase n=1 Tax=Parasalinivibrio latis TaxID=2952610 RepID=UPI0030E0227B
MKAVIRTEYGDPDVFSVVHLDKPKPKPNEILVKVAAVAATSGDSKMRGLQGLPPSMRFITRLVFGVSKPRNPILGSCFSGTVEQIGDNVTQFVVGQEVFGSTGMKQGSYAEYVCLPQTGVVVSKPNEMSFAEGASMSFGGTSALSFLQKAGIQPGESILINGAGGDVGLAALQLAKVFGVTEITAVCGTDKTETVSRMGVRRVIDYQNEDFAGMDDRYDVIFDTVGNLDFNRYKAKLKKGGRMLSAFFPLSAPLRAMVMNPLSSQKQVCIVAEESVGALNYLAELFQSGTFRPLVSHSWPMDDAAKAHWYIQNGHKLGSVVLLP